MLRERFSGWSGVSQVVAGIKGLKKRGNGRRCRLLQKLTTAASPVIHERLEERRLFTSVPYLYALDTAHIEVVPVSSSPGHDISIKPHGTPIGKSHLHRADGSTLAGIAAAIAAAGFDVSDPSENLNGLTLQLIPASQLATDGFAPTGYAPDQLILIAQWANASAGSFSSTAMSACTTGSNLGYCGSGIGAGGELLSPLLGTFQQNNSTCNCEDVNAALTPATLQFMDMVSSCSCGNTPVQIAQLNAAGVKTDAGNVVSPPTYSVAPVNYADGVVSQSDTDLSSTAFGTSWGITRNWTSNPASVLQSVVAPGINGSEDPTTDVFGNNVVENQLARAVVGSDASNNTSIGIATNGNDIFSFNWNGSSYVPTNVQDGSLTVTGGSISTSTSLTWISESGAVVTFHGFDSSIPVTEQGQFSSFASTDGVTTTATYQSSSGLLLSVSTSYNASGTTYVENYAYSYVNYSGGSITLQRVSGIQQSMTIAEVTDYVQNVQYQYYGYTTDPFHANGNFGDLESATVCDGQNTTDPINTDFYVYDTYDSATTYAGGLEFVVTGANYARLAAMTDPTTAPSYTLAAVANYQFTYDSDDRITSELVAGASGTDGAGSGNGFGLFTYTYTNSDINNTFGYNSWTTKTVVSEPNGTDEIVYTNFAGQVMLDVIDENAGGSTTPSASDPSWVTDYQYNSAGQVTQIAEPSSNVLDGSGYAYNDSNPDPSSGYISPSSGLVEQIAYGSSTTATNSSAGNVAGYEMSISYQNGTGATAIPQEAWTYIAHNYSGGATVYALASDTTYGQNASGDARTTGYSYTWMPSSDSVASATMTLPLISTAQDGPGGSSYDTASIAYDNLGEPVWTQDGDGHVMYTQYNITTGAIVLQTEDVNFNSSRGSIAGYPTTYLPSSWTLSTGGLNIAETMTVDDQGRTTQVVSPTGNITDTVYDDPGHEIRTYVGVQRSGGALVLTVPAEIYREVWNASDGSTFTETLTYTGAIDLTPNDSPTLSSGSIQTLSRSLFNNAGQMIETDRYIDVTSVGYNASTPQLGASDTNFYPTTFDYDSFGNLDRTMDANGTIYRTVYDGLDRPTSSWVGTSDYSGWTPGGGDLVDMSDTVYDGGGVGDSTITSVTEHPTPGNSSNDRLTTYAYDFRDRPILETDGSGSAQPIVIATTYDNADEVTEVQQYAGATYTIGGSNGALLRAQSTTQYDDQGRPYQTSSFNVTQSGGSAGTVGTAMTTKMYYDALGDVMATESPTGLWTKMVYDGADRISIVYQTDGAAGTSWTNASGVSADHVFSQVAYTYDGDGNVILTASADRFSTDSTASGTDVGPLGNPTTAPKARVSYIADYYDAADRPVADIDAGTFQGSSYTLPVANNATGGSTTSLVDTSFTGGGSYVGDVIAIITGTGAGERATITGYNSSTHTFTFAAIANAPDSTSGFIIVDPVSLLTQTEYNAAGWVQSSIDPKGLDTQESYDLLGRTIQTIADYTDGMATDSSNQITDYSYDGDDNVIKMTAQTSTGSQISHYVYGVNSSTGSLVNDNDLLYQVQYPDPVSGTNTSTGTYNQSEGYVYDALGEQIGYTDRNGTAHTYTYDSLGRLTADSVSAGAGVDSTVTKLGYTYNDAGEMATATSFNASGVSLNQVQETYDGFGNLLSDAQSHSGNVSGGTPTVDYSYDAANGDRPTGITYPDGRAISYNYSSGLASIASRISSVRDSSGSLQSYTYLGLDTPVTFNSGNGVMLSYLGTVGATTGDGGDQYSGLDRFGRIIDQNWSTASTGAGIDQFAYGYDADSNVTYRQVTTNTSSGTINSTLAGMSQLYTYDGLNRLTNFSTGTLTFSGSTATITSPTSTEGWNLDALGNWKSSNLNGTNTNRSNSAQNQVTTVGTATLGYDLNGDTTKDQTGQEYTYDAWNRLVQVNNSSGVPIADYSYDADGRRIVQAENSVTTDLYYSNRWQVVQENVGSLITAEHVWSPFYVDSMIETDTNPQVTTNQSNGSVDTTFGTSGVANPTLSTDGSTHLTAYADDGTAGPYGGDILVASGDQIDRLLPNGTADSTFGTGGVATLSGAAYINGIVAEANGNVLVAYQTYAASNYVAEFNANGTLDSSFGTSGIATVSGTDATFSLCVRSDGEILVGGTTFSGDLTLTLLAANGAADGSFGTSGTTDISIGDDGSLVPGDLLIEPNGSVLMGVADLYGDTTLKLYQFSPTGTYNTSFGVSGVATTSLTQLYAGQVNGICVLGDGDILVAGLDSSNAVAVTQLLPGGSIDTSFGSSGVAGSSDTGLTDWSVVGMEVTPGGILVGSGVNPVSGGSGSFHLNRFTLAGSVDTSFGTSGESDGESVSWTYGMAVQTDGKVVMIGGNSSGELTLQRFNTEAAPIRLYVEQDANENVTSLTNSSGTVVERYDYTPYGIVTVLNPDGTTRGDGTAASSDYNQTTLWQGQSFSVSTGTYNFRNRIYILSLGRFGQQDPDGYVNGFDRYQLEVSGPIGHHDPAGLQVAPNGPGVLGMPSSDLNAMGSLALACRGDSSAFQYAWEAANYIPHQNAPTVHSISFSAEFTFVMGASANWTYVWDDAGDSALIWNMSGRIGANVGLGAQFTELPGTFDDNIATENNGGWDMSGGVSIFSATLQSGDTPDSTAIGGGLGVGPPQLKIGLSAGLDFDPWVIWKSGPTKCPVPKPITQQTDASNGGFVIPAPYVPHDDFPTIPKGFTAIPPKGQPSQTGQTHIPILYPITPSDQQPAGWYINDPVFAANGSLYYPAHPGASNDQIR